MITKRFKSLPNKLTILLAIILLPFQAISCWCDVSLSYQYDRAKVVAIVKILSLTPDSTEGLYHDADIEMIKSYKGEKLSKIKVRTDLNSSCRFMPEIGDKLLIYASVTDNILSFDMCSYDDISKSDSSGSDYRKKNMDLRLEVLQFLKHKKIERTHPGKAIFIDLQSVKGYKSQNKFAAFELKTEQNNLVKDVKTIKKFDNPDLNQEVINAIKNKKSFLRGKNSRFTLICYYKKSSGTVSIFDP
jgi:hypothetical protein